ncbi:TetR/AcrR family transcriptional regulator [Aldersonia sp. NBC_00410]|uniref:TetR/AcrR family transcriptional regulator n=1 Tax=Aldersonia sp. NBC_00410 TaxID=2975954 RepID=UPI0022520375|nr:TetR/AcrR family transcriptional regulator [Aldersonia sp. NBC_00410]MCX5045061.1 TetR/AcrR family transcriptional regulator [Aldersonia sp. NBC_00410]
MNSTTRDRILDAVEQLLLDRGVQQVTLEAVANEAGVSKGGLLYHFNNKDALLAGMVRRLGERADRQLADAVQAGESVAEWYLAPGDSNDELEVALFRSMLAVMRSVDAPDSEVQRAMVDVMRSWDSGVQREIDDPVQAEIVRLVGDGLYLGALLGLPDPDPELHRQVVARLLGR